MTAACVSTPHPSTLVDGSSRSTPASEFGTRDTRLFFFQFFRRLACTSAAVMMNVTSCESLSRVRSFGAGLRLYLSMIANSSDRLSTRELSDGDD